MRSVYKIVFIFVVGIMSLLACDEIQEPFIEYHGECGDASMPIPIKQILIEEFTGHQCGNCPEAAAMIEILKELYCDHVIPVAIHAGYFAEVKTVGEKYIYDYRTEDGNTLDTYFEASSSGVPNAMINRKKINNDLTLSPTNWSTVVAEMLFVDVVEMLLEDPVLDINISTSYLAGSRDLEIDVDVVFIENMKDKLMLSIYFVEDSIVSWQKDYSLLDDEQDVELYAHNHVLRDAVNGIWGDEILNGEMNANEVKSKSFTYKINENWIIKNSSIVAFVYKNDTKEVLQASQAFL